MLNIQITPHLHWSENVLYWGRLCLVAIFKKESKRGAYYELRGIAFEDWLREVGGKVWMDSDGPLRIPDNGNIHDFISLLYQQVLSWGEYSASVQKNSE